jgi:hypothetical protein
MALLINGSGLLKIVSLNGHVLMSLRVHGSAAVDRNAIPAGIYLATFSDGTHTMSKTIVRQH